MGTRVGVRELSRLWSFRIDHGDQSLSVALFAFSDVVFVDVITHLKWSLSLYIAGFTLFYRVNNGLQFLL